MPLAGDPGIRSRPASGAASGQGQERRISVDSGAGSRLRRAKAHVQADGGAGPAGAELDEVADLVDHPEPLTAESAERRRPPAGQRVGDPALIVQLADDAVPGAP